MAYDPYYTGQPDYYQDPYQDGGYGYDGYGYDEYGSPYTPTPPPAPDKNWVDPVKVNKDYLKKIQKSSVHKGFEGLREESLFLVEVTIRSISLNKDVYEKLVSSDKKSKPFMTFVRLLDTPFVEVNETEKLFNKDLSGEFRTNTVLSISKSFTNLFQSIYSTTGDHDSIVPEEEDERGGGGEGENESRSKDTTSGISKKETPIEKVSANIEEVEKIQIMKGKSILLPMPYFSMIQKLQQYPLVIKVTHCDVMDDDTEVEGEVLATSFLRLPETFRKAVLVSCRPATILPLVVVDTNNHTLMDPQGGEVGVAELTLVLTCFGKGAVNCVTEAEDNHEYVHTFLLRHLKAKHVVAEENLKPLIDPRLAKEIVKLGLFLPSDKTSSEILQDCISSNLIPADEEERRHAQRFQDCDWFRMVRKALPSSSHSFDFEKYIEKMEMERAVLWEKHKKICRDLKNCEPLPRRSLEDRLRDVQMVQTGVTGVETQNPFEEMARHSQLSGVSLNSGNSNRSPRGSLKK